MQSMGFDGFLMFFLVQSIVKKIETILEFLINMEFQ